MPAVNATNNKACTTKEKPSERTVPVVGGGANSRWAALAFMAMASMRGLWGLMSVNQLHGQTDALNASALQGVHGFDHGFVFDGAVSGDHHRPLRSLALQAAHIF